MPDLSDVLFNDPQSPGCVLDAGDIPPYFMALPTKEAVRVRASIENLIQKTIMSGIAKGVKKDAIFASGIVAKGIGSGLYTIGGDIKKYSIKLAEQLFGDLIETMEGKINEASDCIKSIAWSLAQDPTTMTVAIASILALIAYKYGSARCIQAAKDLTLSLSSTSGTSDSKYSHPLIRSTMAFKAFIMNVLSGAASLTYAVFSRLAISIWNFMSSGLPHIMKVLWSWLKLIIKIPISSLSRVLHETWDSKMFTDLSASSKSARTLLVIMAVCVETYTFAKTGIKTAVYVAGVASASPALGVGAAAVGAVGLAVGPAISGISPEGGSWLTAKGAGALAGAALASVGAGAALSAVGGAPVAAPIAILAGSIYIITAGDMLCGLVSLMHAFDTNWCDYDCKNNRKIKLADESEGDRAAACKTICQSRPMFGTQYQKSFTLREWALKETFKAILGNTRGIPTALALSIYSFKKYRAGMPKPKVSVMRIVSSEDMTQWLTERKKQKVVEMPAIDDIPVKYAASA